jgi:ribonuclease VapC
MVVDSSALLAILQDEPESQHFTDLMLGAPVRLVSASTWFEASMVMLSRRGEAGLADLVAFCRSAGIETVPFDAAHAELALEGFRRFGKGRHRAGLNFGDCVSYALARATDEPLLFKGEDFGHTDVKRAA